jgi:hypothetical protein
MGLIVPVGMLRIPSWGYTARLLDNRLDTKIFRIKVNFKFLENELNLNLNTPLGNTVKPNETYLIEHEGHFYFQKKFSLELLNNQKPLFLKEIEIKMI